MSGDGNLILASLRHPNGKLEKLKAATGKRVAEHAEMTPRLSGQNRTQKAVPHLTSVQQARVLGIERHLRLVDA